MMDAMTNERENRLCPQIRTRRVMHCARCNLQAVIFWLFYDINQEYRRLLGWRKADRKLSRAPLTVTWQ